MTAIKIKEDQEKLENLQFIFTHYNNDEFEIISIDEAIFTQKCVVKHCWAQRGCNINPKQLASYEPATAVVGAMSSERGWIGQLMR